MVCPKLLKHIQKEKTLLIFIDNVKKKILKLYEEDFYQIDHSGVISKLYKSIPSQLAKGSRKFYISRATKERKTDSKENKLSELLDSKTVILCAPSVFLSKDEDIEYFKLYIAETGLTFPF